MENRAELLRLLSGLCDEHLEPAEQVRLEELLADQEARRLYLEYVDLHSRLLTHPATAGGQSLPGVEAVATDGVRTAYRVPRKPSPEVVLGASLMLTRADDATAFGVAAAALLVNLLVLVPLAIWPNRPPT